MSPLHVLKKDLMRVRIAVAHRTLSVAVVAGDDVLRELLPAGRAVTVRRLCADEAPKCSWRTWRGSRSVGVVVRSPKSRGNSQLARPPRLLPSIVLTAIRPVVEPVVPMVRWNGCASLVRTRPGTDPIYDCEQAAGGEEPSTAAQNAIEA